MEAKQAADTDPTYPNRKMLTDRPKASLPLVAPEGEANVF